MRELVVCLFAVVVVVVVIVVVVGIFLLLSLLFVVLFDLRHCFVTLHFQSN
jgi:hypothetical protein